MSLESVKVLLTPDEVLLKGLILVGFDEKRQERVDRKKNLSRFRTHYASDPAIYAVLLSRLQGTDNNSARLSFDAADDKRVGRIGVEGILKYFFMSIHFLACYPTEEEAEAIFKVSDRSYRSWVWEIVEKIALLKPEIIQWPAEWNNSDSELDANHSPPFTTDTI